MLFNKKIGRVIVALVALATGWYFFSTEKKIDYNTQVKPILNKKCISCHGGVKQSGGFSVLFREEALAKTESGKPAIIPGKPNESEFIRRLTLTDPEERMPYKHDPLPAGEIKILKNWVKQGAVWGKHWAYISVEKQTLPDEDDWGNNDIDRFIAEKLNDEKLSPSAQADKPTLLRRVSLDLTGVPAPDVVAKTFLNDKSEKAYENLVDALLASPSYGERWTSLWLDLARYADTKGYEKDAHRSIWRYRDWLIKAFNEDKSYDRFLIEQIAGDLMPDPTDAQYIATAFQRNTLANDEGGTDNEEYRTAAVIDRVNTTWEALMGTTFACVQCHAHPYDPFKHEDYYRFMAFFNNTRDEDTFEDFPFLKEYKNADSLKFENLKTWLSLHATAAEKERVVHFLKTGQPVINAVVSDAFTNSALADTKWLSLRNNGSSRIKNVALDNKTELMFRYTTGIAGGLWQLHIDSLKGPVIASVILKPTQGWQVATIDIGRPTGGVHDIWFSYHNPALKTPEENGAMFSWFYFKQPFPGAGRPGFDTAYKWYNELTVSGNYTGTPILVENPEDMFRTTNMFERGSWLSKGKVVQAGVPAVLNTMPVNAPQNRLGLAMWLTDKKNPLTARTMVNRLWEQLFGMGIVETLEDLGTQGMTPTHKELLDHLSWQFMNNYQWSIKKILKEMVMSATYRQRSEVPDELLQKDPANKFYARGPRVRLSAEQLRDQALAVSKVLSSKMYGQSVMPYQPAGIWKSPYNGADWKKSEGEDQYRRAVYTYWKRSAPYPTMIGFDAAMRDVCLPRRIRTNTPLQALSTLNDSAYVDMARHFATRMEQMAGNNPKQQIEKGYEGMMYKSISPAKLQALMGLYNTSLQSFSKNKQEAVALMGDLQKQNASPQKAAMVVVANAMLNLDEWLTKG